MKQIGAYEAKVHLGQILDDVQDGEAVEITRHGVPVARLVPVREDNAVPASHAIQQLMDFGERRSFAGWSFQEALQEGRR